MQKARLFIFLFFLISGLVDAQTVEIPDPIFKSCLLNTYPQSFENNGLLNIQTAEIQTAEMICSQKGIKSVEGIQYFKNVKKIDVSQNAIDRLPDLSGLNNLEELILSDNQIDTLPGIGYMSNLYTLSISDNLIRDISEIEYLSNLKLLLADNNPLIGLPYMDRFSTLQRLQISGCGLTELADFSKLSNLKFLSCNNNKLKNLPDFTELGNLEFLDAGSNLLETVPVLPANNRLREVFLDNNNIRSLSNFVWSDSVLVYNLNFNLLSFEDFLPLIEFLNYQEKVYFSEQKTFPEFRDLSLLENEVLNFELSQIGFTESQIVSWYRNDTLIASGSDIYFIIESVAKKDGGVYTTKVTHPQFPDITLFVEPALLKVENCLETDYLSFSKHDLNCENLGALTVSTSDQPQAIENYILYSTQNSGEIYSADGNFDKLEEGVYLLSIRSGNCVKEYPDSIKIGKKTCKSIFITPNGDGIDEDYYISERGNAVIRDKSGYLIKEIQLPGSWDGTSQSGKVSPGLYFIDINNGEHIIQISVVY